MEERIEEPGVKNPAHLLRHKLQENRKSLHIARIPDKTKETFIALAEEEFCGDYGMLLAHVWKEFNEFKKLKEMFFEGKLKEVFRYDKKNL